MNNMPSKKSIISLALGSALAATLGTASIASAAESPFAVQSLNKGYMVAGSHDYGDKKNGYDDGDNRGDYPDRKDGYGDKKRGEGRCGMAMADTNNDGRVSRDEHARHAETMFDRMDTNKDGYIDKDEANAMKKKRHHGHGHDQKSGDGYESSAGNGVDITRDRVYGSGQRYNRDLPHMKPMGD